MSLQLVFAPKHFITNFTLERFALGVDSRYMALELVTVVKGVATIFAPVGFVIVVLEAMSS